MFEKPRPNALADVVRSGPAIHPDFAADAVSDYIMASPRAKREKMLEFVENGLSEVGTEVVRSSRTPNGYAFNRADNPSRHAT